MLDFLRQLATNLIPPSLASWQAALWILIFIFIIGNLIFNLAVRNIILSVLAIDEIFKQIRQTLTPPKPDSWQTLIWISIFSWLMSLLPISDITQGFIATCAWCFLIPGIHWFMYEEKLKVFNSEVNVKKGLTVSGIFLGPWITGAMVCILLFSDVPDNRNWVRFICWPPISAIIAATPKFIATGPKWKKPDPAARQDLVILFLSNFLLSCWFQLYFLTQSWLVDYPSLRAQDLSKSAFVVRFQGGETMPSRGVAMLDQAESVVKEQLDGQYWSQVERWLFDLRPQMQQVETIVKGRLTPVAENALWHLDGRVLPRTEYQLRMIASWEGPSANGTGYYLTKSCQITRVTNSRLPIAQTANASTQIARVSCDPVAAPTEGQPDTGT